MTERRSRLEAYEKLFDIDALWLALAEGHQGQRKAVGQSTEGRTLWQIEFGDSSKPTFFLSSLMHGIELVSGFALLETIKTILSEENRKLLDSVHLVVMPVVNPDSLHRNLERLHADKFSCVRCNARGVDINRNFPRLSPHDSWHPFAGSKNPWSMYYMGPHAFSEPESRAVRSIALDTRPLVSLGFHSCGNLLLHPWSSRSEPHPRIGLYTELGNAFVRALPGEKYEVRQARRWYPTVGDLDDWLDTRFQTMAFTVEVSKPRLHDNLRLRKLFDPYAWMNPANPESACRNVAPGVVSLMQRALEVLPKRLPRRTTESPLPLAASA
jgi:carboxypeptidase T